MGVGGSPRQSPPVPSPSLLLHAWQVCNPRSEVLHGQHSPHTDPVQERPREIRTTKTPGRWCGRARPPAVHGHLPCPSEIPLASPDCPEKSRSPSLIPTGPPVTMSYQLARCLEQPPRRRCWLVLAPQRRPGGAGGGGGQHASDQIAQLVAVPGRARAGAGVEKDLRGCCTLVEESGKLLFKPEPVD